MFNISYDLHIHSCLSPCGDDESTPSSIAVLSDMLGLKAVALTDHNSCKNCPAFFKAAENLGIIPIAGMEITTSEEIHVVCLFPKLEKAMAFDEIVHSALLPIENDSDIYGNQLIMDENDEVIGNEKYCLINATSIDLYSLSGIVSQHGGIIIPAHIDRSAFSLISTLGMVPSDNGFDCVEIKYKDAVENLKSQHPYLNNCKIIHDSDAHYLENISIGENKIEVEEETAEGVLRALSAEYRKR